jgi:hypothetical protein
MRRRTISALLIVVACATGCGSGGGPEVTSTTDAAPGPAVPSADQPQARVRLDAPKPDAALRAVRAPDGTLRATVDISGHALASQTVDVDLSCPGRSCRRFALTDTAGAFSVRMTPTLPAALSRLTVEVDYATGPSAETVASVKVSVHRPRVRRAKATTAPTTTERSPAPPPTETPPAVTAPQQTTQPDGPPAPSAARGTMTVIGDSLAVGMKPYLTSLLPGWTVAVDGRVGRPLAEGMAIVHAARLPTSGSSVLAISLFTNDDPRNTAQLSAAIDDTLQRVGAAGCVIWATIARDPVAGVSYRAANALLVRKAAATPRLRLADWAGYVDAHPGTLSTGNVHPGPAGYRARASLYAQAVAGCP